MLKISMFGTTKKRSHIELQKNMKKIRGNSFLEKRFQHFWGNFLPFLTKNPAQKKLSTFYGEK